MGGELGNVDGFARSVGRKGGREKRMGQHKHNPTAIAAKNGELPPKKREPQLTKRKVERLLRLKIIRTIDPFHALPDGMAGVITGGMPYG